MVVDVFIGVESIRMRNFQLRKKNGFFIFVWILMKKKKVELALSKRKRHYHNLVLEIETVLPALDETVDEGDVDICTTFTCACSTNQRLSDSER